MPGVVGLALVAVAVGAILACAPWRNPNTPYWKLLLPVYAAFAASLVWGVRAAGGIAPLGLNRWNLFLVLPLLIPFATLGKRRWNDFEK